MWATAVWATLSILASLALFGQRPYLRKALLDANAKAKSPKADYAAHVDHDIHNLLLRGLIQTVLVGVIVMLLALLTFRGRRMARWGLLAMCSFLGLLFGVGVISQLVLGAVLSAPGLYKSVFVLAGIMSLVVVVLLLHRTTRTYFAALRATERGAVPRVPGARAPRPAGGGLGALFSPRRRMTPASDETADVVEGRRGGRRRCR